MDVDAIFKSIEGAVLPADVMTKLVVAINAAGAVDSAAEVETKTGQLKLHNDKLIGEQRDAKAAAVASKAAEDAKELERIKATGDLEALRVFTDNQNKEALQKLQDSNDKLTAANSARDLATIHGEFGAMFVDSAQAKALLKTMVTIGEDGVSTFKNLAGEVVATDQKGFTDWMRAEKSFDNLLKAPSSNGGGGNGSGDPPAPTDKQNTFDTLLAKKDRTPAENLELSKQANELKKEQQSKED